MVFNQGHRFVRQSIYTPWMSLYCICLYISPAVFIQQQMKHYLDWRRNSRTVRFIDFSHEKLPTYECRWHPHKQSFVCSKWQVDYHVYFDNTPLRQDVLCFGSVHILYDGIWWPVNQWYRPCLKFGFVLNWRNICEIHMSNCNLCMLFHVNYDIQLIHIIRYLNLLGALVLTLTDCNVGRDKKSHAL